MKKKLFLCVTLLLGIGIFNNSIQVFADNTSTSTTEKKVVNERWGKPTLVLGAGLNQQQQTETMNLLKVTSTEVKTDYATGQDLITYLGSGSGDDSVMLSSVVVNRENEGSGITVDIVTPENITLITADQYKNPLVTAGISDATVNVASITPVTGESALTGVYKAFASNGEAIDPERAKLAQEELGTTTDVAQNIVNSASDTKNYQKLSDDEKAKAEEAYKNQLNQTLVEIKQELAKLNKKQDELATKSDIEDIVNKALKKNELQDYVTQEDVQKLVKLGEGYQATTGVLDNDSLSQLDKLGDSFSTKSKELTDGLANIGKNISDKNWFQKAWDNTKNFFSGIVTGVKELFAGKEDTENTVESSTKESETSSTNLIETSVSE